MSAVEFAEDPAFRMLRYFEFQHLPAHLQEASRPFCDLAHLVAHMLPAGAEKSAALRKLLEAKDCAVRAMLEDVDRA